MTLVLCNDVVECREKGSWQRVFMYVCGSSRMPTVVVLYGAESTVIIFLPKKTNLAKHSYNWGFVYLCMEL